MIEITTRKIPVYIETFWSKKDGKYVARFLDSKRYGSIFAEGKTIKQAKKRLKIAAKCVDDAIKKNEDKINETKSVEVLWKHYIELRDKATYVGDSVRLVSEYEEVIRRLKDEKEALKKPFPKETSELIVRCSELEKQNKFYKKIIDELEESNRRNQ